MKLLRRKPKLSQREGGASIVDTPGKELCTKSFSVIITTRKEILLMLRKWTNTMEEKSG